MPAAKLAVSGSREAAVPGAVAQGKKGRASPVDIVDIRMADGEIDLKEEVAKLFNPVEGPRKLPTLLLYDEKGLQLFEEITYLDEYYLTNSEIEVLKKSSTDIASRIPNGSMVIELGSGNLRKVSLLLRALEDAEKKIDYYALDLDQHELERTLALTPNFKHVSCHGLHGTYDDGKEWMKQPSILERTKCILHLGSSIGNFDRTGSAEFLAGFANVLGPSDFLLVGVDSCSDPEQIFRAYNDELGITHRFTLNGLEHANEIYGEEIFNMQDWKAIGEYVHDEDGGRHQAFVQPLRPTTVLGSVIQPFEKIKIEESWKFSPQGLSRLWKQAGLKPVTTWDNGKEYGLHMLQKQNLPFPSLPARYGKSWLPTLDDWAALWEAWDVVTRDMLPEEELVEKPIKLRNACIFYLGHIPAFLDIQLTKTTGKPATDPAYFHPMFERGIDPDVDDPSKCHDHSEVPSEWPPLKDILDYQEDVRARVRSLYGPKGDTATIPRKIGRAIWLGFEHEILHLETLLYMMLQSELTLPPPLTLRPNFEAMARKAFDARVPNEWFTVPEQTISLGMEDPEDLEEGDGHFAWDIEKPERTTKVHKFEAQGRPITNEEYAKYLYHEKISGIPASWCEKSSTTTHTNGHSSTATSFEAASSAPLPDSFLQGKYVRTVYGLVPLSLALDWPVFASYNELEGCASWMGGRIPTFEETRSLYSFVDDAQARLLARKNSKLARKVPAVNGHLINDGVEESPPQLASDTSSPSTSLYVDLSSENVGFKNWHPTPVTHLGNQLGGQASMGGVWEWTATTLRAHEGFQAMKMYPGYSADFFDEKHNIVLGGSWATHPRVAGRKSFVNWYQRNYPYAWVGARLVRDV